MGEEGREGNNEIILVNIIGNDLTKSATFAKFFFFSKYLMAKEKFEER